MSKELFIAAHEQLIDEALSADPKIEWETAYESTADEAWNRMVDNMAHKADRLHDIAKGN